MKNVARELICLDALVKGQSNAINSSFASILGWNGSVNSVKVDYPIFNSYKFSEFGFFQIKSAAYFWFLAI